MNEQIIEVEARTMARGLVEVRCPHCGELHSHRVATVTDGFTVPRRGDCGLSYRIRVKSG